MAVARSWRESHALEGPVPVRVEDIDPLNVVFSEAFTERYRRDGMVGVRVPSLNPAIWRYAIEDAADGAMLWRDAQGQIAAFNIAHLSGSEGWMGPLAVRPDCQGSGAGKRIVRAGIEWLEQRGARIIGLETMPRTMENIGFYSALGFVPKRLTITLTLDASPGDRTVSLLGRLSARNRERTIEECRALVRSLRPEYDFTREIELTDRLSLGDTLLLRDGDALAGFALCHTAPLVEGRVREELRVLKLVLARHEDAEVMARLLRDFARRSGTRRVAIRIQGVYEEMYERFVALGARVRWTDLRMTHAGREEPVPARGVILSNWEI